MTYTTPSVIAEVDTIVLGVLREKQPRLVAVLDDLLQAGQPPAAILQAVAHNRDVSPLLHSMVEGAIRALQSEHAQESRP